MVNSKTTVMEVMNTLQQIETSLKYDELDDKVFQLLEGYRDYLLMMEVR